MQHTDTQAAHTHTQIKKDKAGTLEEKKKKKRVKYVVHFSLLPHFLLVELRAKTNDISLFEEKKFFIQVFFCSVKCQKLVSYFTYIPKLCILFKNLTEITDLQPIWQAPQHKSN